TFLTSRKNSIERGSKIFIILWCPERGMDG
ncbi:hypothetical protein EV294_109202, partial [Paenibacillus sp. BK033]